MTGKNKLRTLIDLDKLEPAAADQIEAALEMPFLEALAIMPDCHPGYHLPIGGVALLREVVSPSYVGYDIGCGMCHIKTDLPASDLRGREDMIFAEVYNRIPVGFESRRTPLDYRDFKSASGEKKLDKKVAGKLKVQLGTLGGGNHFIEFGEAEDGSLAVTIHSGSRNMGHSIATHHMKTAKEKERDLPQGFLRLRGKYGREYVKDMEFALEYALENRRVMMLEMLDVLGQPNALMGRMINQNHNHASVNRDGAVLHRKGATPAEKGEPGVIPGNMRDGVYVTVGLGNRKYLCSASHGAGRTMSRKAAKKQYSLTDFHDAMTGVKARVEPATLDEAPFVYKNLDEVIAMQRGVVIDIVDRTRPLVNIKG
jgi:tRNA-splicing ligase RtcB